MKALPESIVAKAFWLSNARGAELLARLGDFDVWHGDLTVMRDDEPRLPPTNGEPQTRARTARGLLDTLVLTRAIELLDPTCRAALSKVYTRLSAREPMQANARHVVTDCEKRLLEIYDSLTSERSDTTVTGRMSARDDAAERGSGRR